MIGKTISHYRILEKIGEGGTFARYLPTGHLVFSRSDALYAVKFDPDRLVVSGSPERVLTGVAFSGGRGISRYAVADNGALLYLPGGDTMWGNEIALLDREGKAQPLVQTPGAYFPSSLSPDGRFVAIPIASSNNDIWLFDTKRHTQTRLTFEGENARPTWSPDGRWLAYQSDESGQDEVYVQAFEGSGRRTPISVDGGSNPKWSPTGDELFFLNNNKMMAVKISTGTEMNAGRPQTLFELPPAGGPEAVRFDLART